jgi:hypothetical protein
MKCSGRQIHRHNWVVYIVRNRTFSESPTNPIAVITVDTRSEERPSAGAHGRGDQDGRCRHQEAR